jgi:ribosomal protein S27AE
MTDKPITIAAQGTFTSGASAGGAGGIPVSDRDDPSLAKGGSSNLPSGPSPSSAGSNELANALRGLLEIEDARIATGAFTPNVEAQKRIDTARKLLDYHGNEPQTPSTPIPTSVRAALTVIANATQSEATSRLRQMAKAALAALDAWQPSAASKSCPRCGGVTVALADGLACSECDWEGGIPKQQDPTSSATRPVPGGGQ